MHVLLAIGKGALIVGALIAALWISGAWRCTRDGKGEGE